MVDVWCVRGLMVCIVCGDSVLISDYRMIAITSAWPYDIIIISYDDMISYVI